MAASLPISLSALPPLPSTKLKLKTHHFHGHPNSFALICPFSASFSSSKAPQFQARDHQKRGKLRKIFAGSGETLPSDPTPLENSALIVSTTSDDGVAYIIQVLLFVAFLALTILTVGVIYIGVQEFLQKRETEKFAKEEAAQNKGKRKKVRARAGPRGFGQKIDVDDDLD